MENSTLIFRRVKKSRMIIMVVNVSPTKLIFKSKNKLLIFPHWISPHAPEINGVNGYHRTLYLSKVKRVPHSPGPSSPRRRTRYERSMKMHALCNCAHPFLSRARSVFSLQNFQINPTGGEEKILPRLTNAFPSSIRSVVSSSDWRNCAKPIEERQRVPSLKYVPVQRRTIRMGK